MEKIKITANKRDIKKEKAKKLRREGLIPAVIYGKGKDSLPLKVEALSFNKVYKQAGHSTIIDLSIDGSEKKVLVQDVSVHPVTDNIEHIDFYEVSMKEKITTTVPLKFVGDAPAVADLGGTLLTSKDELEIECLPTDLPHEIEVDLSVLSDFEAVIHVADIKIPQGVEVKDEAEETVASVEPPRSEEELAELEEPIEEAEMPESEHGEEGEVEEAEGQQEENIEENKEE